MASALAAAALYPVSGGAAAAPRWSGTASCTISVTAPGYQHVETQRWQVGGPVTLRGIFRLEPSRWTDTGSGSSHVTQGDQSRDITWTVQAAAAGQFQFVVRASDKKLLIAQANAQLRFPNGITGKQQVTIGGVPQTPGPIGQEAFETQFPPVITGQTSRKVAGSKGVPANGSVGPFQPAGATITKRCALKFSKAG
jgi:hypothetical protein